MSFFATIHEAAAMRKLRLIVIGGMAVNHYGYARDTGDLDFLVSRDDREARAGLLKELGYASFHDGGSFLQFDPPAQNAWPVDLMLVQEKTFAPMFDASQAADLFGVMTRVPSLEHLLALKLHTLKHTRMSRFLKDFLDVENLIRVNRPISAPRAFANCSPDTARLTCMKNYPDPSPTADALRDASPVGALEFPVAADFVSRPPKVALPAMLRRIEENMPWRNRRPGEAQRRLAEKIPVEFAL